ncbi:hypothetical protein LCGC14_1708540 [marine sediment metagenome]|uniref:Uncharacterized protein n=1 Tax=marine sediment metagenome TaxID=412755 RepID=A0A0F9KFZ1_9ZZZZ
MRHYHVMLKSRYTRNWKAHGVPFRNQDEAQSEADYMSAMPRPRDWTKVEVRACGCGDRC